MATNDRSTNRKSQSTPKNAVHLGDGWQHTPPVLSSDRVILKEVRPDDAAALLEMFGDPDVAKHLSATPNSVEAFQRFARWARRERRDGRFVCFIARQRETGKLVGVFQVWRLEPSFATAEWGMAIARPYWGHGLGREAATRVADFALETLGVERLESRIAAANHRGAGVLKALGAVDEGLLRQCFKCGDRPVDHVMWSILRADWKRQHAA